jgi:hypothetical protein
MMDENLLCFNGIDGASGEYLLPPQPAAVVSAVVRGEEVDEANLSFLKRWWERVSQAHFAPTSNVDPCELSSAGWGVIFADDVTQNSPVYRALAPLSSNIGDIERPRSRSTTTRSSLARSRRPSSPRRIGRTSRSRAFSPGTAPDPARPTRRRCPTTC